ncbi:helix-turn-helix domain-containing protein [Fuerstiella marisgermanici]|uniref:Helix-turn-helix domain-containing protein n=1 Tax=Fuerstiella marisgermanici TaxID=1891926 RepID=A0A1P8WRR6_9PLAN|nr:helix-turn-helix domain-containing protein [Fuerstiella marisgermanici]APZ96751.1 hypothetical protein Fuma_06424 [Fuerstiella marisgermanici]
MTNAVIMSEKQLQQLKDELASDILKGVERLLASSSEERAVDRRQMAETLGVGIATIDRLVSQGVIPSMLINSRRAFLPSEVFEALKAKSAA